MLTEEPEMLQTDAFCEHTMQQNANVAGVPQLTPLGKLAALPRHPSWFIRTIRGKEGEGSARKSEGQGGMGEEGRLTWVRSWELEQDRPCHY